MLKWHNRLSHLYFGKIQDLPRQGKLPKALIGCDPPICCSCQYGKAHRRPSVSQEAASPIDSEDLQPGDKVSVDQIESTTPGYVDIYKEKPTTARFTAALVYVDHASRYTFVKCHYTTSGMEAIEGKQRFEQLASSFSMKIKSYRADNGIMACQEYVHHVNQNQQTISYCGVNHHAQYGIAE
jgi:hypothetical protein